MNLVSISFEEYAQLKWESEFLAALQAAGVDNWEGYSVACRMMDDPDLDARDL